MEHREQCDPRMFLTSTLEIILERASDDDIRSEAPRMAYKMAAAKRFPFPVPAWFAVLIVAVSVLQVALTVL